MLIDINVLQQQAHFVFPLPNVHCEHENHLRKFFGPQVLLHHRLCDLRAD